MLSKNGLLLHDVAASWVKNAEIATGELAGKPEVPQQDVFFRVGCMDFGFAGEALHLPQIVRGEQAIIKRPCPLETFLEHPKESGRPRAVFEHYLPKTSPILDLIQPFSVGKDVLPDLLEDPTHSSLSIVASDEGFYTRAHVDFAGTLGWMALVRGQKVWSFWNPHGPSKRAFLAGLKSGKGMPEPDITFVANGGDLVFIPAGCGHAVSTTKHSFGFGGSLFVSEQSLVGLGASLRADVQAQGLSSSDARVEIGRQRRGIAEVLGVSLRQLSQREAVVVSEAVAAESSFQEMAATILVLGNTPPDGLHQQHRHLYFRNEPEREPFRALDPNAPIASTFQRWWAAQRALRDLRETRERAAAPGQREENFYNK
ncbi:hypothetical protein KFL_006280060 [Klebsormidium nitens]|uniref:JmjC domain-containing protein n=1 Tax=Klebsormidium nitens TaxID=105231 RepID=A0A1Y1IMG0_KLENI|nr:hypothetical protein KFL_006280060 [Klebsormidium nitens]|eukprot:GAQ90331.1 hypothetical protein KFL_006280060 [Klebsormidium nitens]